MEDNRSEVLIYTKTQKKIATVLYILVIIAVLVTIGGTIYTIADLIMATGKMELFQTLNLGYQVAIIGGLLAGLFFLLIFFYGLYKKGVDLILNNIFKKRIYNDRYRGRLTVRLAAGALMFSIFAIIIGILFAVLYDITMRPAGSEGTLSGAFENFSQGQVVLAMGLGLFVIIGLIFFLNYLWYNGYYMILKMITDLED
jgi:hypothetical protein